MSKYNPKYDTKIQPFNISIIKGWIETKNIQELKQWLNEGEPHKRLIKEAIAISTTYKWLDGLKVLFEKDWISLETKLKEVIKKICFCKKDDVWIFVRDHVFADKKLIKKLSFELFWSAKESGKDFLFDENQIDFTNEKATSLLTYRYMPNDANISEERKKEYKEKLNYLLTKPVFFEEIHLVYSMNFTDATEIIEMFKKHQDYPILRTKESLFIFACVAGVYYQSALNHFEKCCKYDPEKFSAEIKRIKEEQCFMLEFLKKQGVLTELDITPKFLDKNNWVNHNLEKNSGDLCGISHYHNDFVYGSLRLKYYWSNESKEKQKLPEIQKIKLAWYWVGGKDLKKRLVKDEKYTMNDEDKKYAEKEFEKIF